MSHNLAGAYIRKSGKNNVYEPTDGWHRKWTYKVAWVGVGNDIQLVAMTDGMTLHNYPEKFFTPKSLRAWMSKNEMVVMSYKEIILFMIAEAKARS